MDMNESKPARNYSILIVEDNTLLREALRSFLGEQPGCEVAGEAGNGLEAVEKYARLRPGVVLMDLSLPGISGEEATRRIKDMDPDARILVLTVHPDNDHVYSALKAGADGYIPKDASSGELFLAIDSVAQGLMFISPQVTDFVVRGYLLAREQCVRLPEMDALTNREAEVLKLVADGMKNKEIAEALFISVKTVEKHRSNILKKLGLKKRELPAFARKASILLEEL